MNIVADTNIFLAVVLDEPEREQIINETSQASIVSPDILFYEMGNALSAMFKRQRLEQPEVLAAFEVAQAIPVRLMTVDIKAALELSMKFNIYAYDGYFLQCAKANDYPLYTFDRRMRDVAKSLGITLVGVDV